METTQRRTAIVQLRRLLRRLDRAHTGEENACFACGLQQMAVQLVDEIEIESERANQETLRPGAASVLLAVESIIATLYALGVDEADEQGRVLQALLDYIGDVVLDQLAQEDLMAPSVGDDQTPPVPPTRRGGALH